MPQAARGIFYLPDLAVVCFHGKRLRHRHDQERELAHRQRARQGITFGISFHGIVFWSIMLCGLLASQALTRDMDEGFASATLARPLGRDAYIAGKLLPVIIISTLNLTVLGGLFCWFFYRATGGITMQIPLSFLFMTLSLVLYGLMIFCLSLFIPRLLAPLAGIVVYMISCWSSCPILLKPEDILDAVGNGAAFTSAAAQVRRFTVYRCLYIKRAATFRLPSTRSRYWAT